MRAFLAAVALLLLAGCATTAPGQDRLAERDPLEGFNRGMWALNRGADQVIVKPVSTVYRTVTPRPARRGLSRVISNLTEPWSFINNLLQGKFDRAADNLGRFVVNTTLGVGGLADHATKIGIKPAPEDFGQTLAHYGVNGGPYLVLPLLGPSTLRDGVGAGIAFFADPANICLKECTSLSGRQRLAVNAFEVVSARSELTESGADAFLKTSLDPYASARSAYLQRRRAEILDQEGVDAPAAAGSGEDDLEPIPSDSPESAASAPADATAAPPPTQPEPPQAPSATPAPEQSPTPAQ